MQIRIEYFAQARDAAGISYETIEIDGPTTATDLVSRIASQRGGRLASLLLGPDGQLAPSVMLAVGDRQSGRDDRSLLRDGDEIVVLPPISGG